MHWKKRHKLRKIVANHAIRRLRKKPYLYNEYVKMVCIHPIYMKSERPLPIISRRSLKRQQEYIKLLTEYKHLILDPILEEYRSYPCATPAEKEHMEAVADQLEAAWDSAQETFLIQGPYNNLPLSTLDFSPLITKLRNERKLEIMGG